ncbi:MAG: glycosyltransferase family 2 protein [Parcubacteria group bacterium]|nr:glycosyltransferase family 2 protein [Parcubacteria group bacterium]
MPQPADLSIVILNYKMDGLVKNCLKSIFSHDYRHGIEVIVVDNGSGDECEAIVARHFPQVRFIQTGTNLGHAAGNNAGIKIASGRYVMILNPDTVFLQPAFDQLVDQLDQQDRVGMATIQLRNPDGSLQPGAWRFHDLATPLFQRVAALRRTKRGQARIHAFEMGDWNRTTSRRVDWAQGSCLTVRREALDEIGLLDERFFLYFTDVDWCRRAWIKGWQVHYFCEPSVIHYYHRESAEAFGWRSLRNKVTRIHIVDWLRYLRKYRGQPRPQIL